MYYRFGKAFYLLSVLVFVFTLLYFYSALPERIGLSVEEEGTVVRDWEKGSFFYGMIAAFILLNAVVIFPPKSLETKSSKKLNRIFPKGDPFRDYLLAWFYSFGGLVNFSLGLLVFYVHAINNRDEFSADGLSAFFYLIPGLLLLWVIGLFVLMTAKFKTLQKS